MRREKEMKGKRCPDAKFFKRHLLQLSNNLSKPLPINKAMSYPDHLHTNQSAATIPCTWETE